MGKVNPRENGEVMCVEQVAAYLGFSVDGIYKMASEKRMPAFKLGNRWRFKKSVVDQWMQKQSEENVGKG